MNKDAWFDTVLSTLKNCGSRQGVKGEPHVPNAVDHYSRQVEGNRVAMTPLRQPILHLHGVNVNVIPEDEKLCFIPSPALVSEIILLLVGLG